MLKRWFSNWVSFFFHRRQKCWACLRNRAFRITNNCWCCSSELKISHESVHSILHDDLNIHHVCLHMCKKYYHLNKKKRVNMCSTLIDKMIASWRKLWQVMRYSAFFTILRQNIIEVKGSQKHHQGKKKCAWTKA